MTQIILNAHEFSVPDFTAYADPRLLELLNSEYTAAGKLRYVVHFARFWNQDCPKTLFHQWFYNLTSNMWHHIAEYNREGFYTRWLADVEGKARFLRHCQRGIGDPAFTYSDVETFLARAVQESGLVRVYNERYTAAVEAAERAELDRLHAKYTNR